METREEKLATWADPSSHQQHTIRLISGSICLEPESFNNCTLTEDTIHFDEIEQRILGAGQCNAVENTWPPNTWHFKVISFPRLRLGRLFLSLPKQTFQKLRDSWNLHPRTIETFLSNNGVLTTSSSPSTGRQSLVLKVANSRATGFDCVSVTCDPARRTTFVLYHHLHDESAVFATLLATPERCVDYLFFVAALYRSHSRHIETQRNTLDDAIQGIERQTGLGNPGRLIPGIRPSLDRYPALDDPKKTLQQMSYCQTDLAIIGHVARCSLDCGEWLLKAADGWIPGDQLPQLRGEPSSAPVKYHQREEQFSASLRAIRLMVREDVEYTRRQIVTLLSQLQQIRGRTESQTSFMLSIITQNDAEYTAAIAVDGKRDSVAMKTISILGIIYLPGTFVASLFSIDMFNWGDDDGSGSSSLSVSRSMWVYWVVAVPLTVVTYLVWAFWAGREDRKITQRLTIRRQKVARSMELIADGKMV